MSPQTTGRTVWTALVFTVAIALIAVKLSDEDVRRKWQDTPCLLRNNYVLMEMTRPVTECQICQNVRQPIVLHNPSKEEFAAVAYSSKPILVKGATKDWQALDVLSFAFFRLLYDGLPGAYESVEDECQFLPFKTEFLTLKEALHMNRKRSRLEPGQPPWYIGWSNCHPEVRRILRSLYQRPSFLPDTSESSALDWIFMGSPGPATTMHLDYVQRPSWQAQIKGRKLWHLLPPPECEAFCTGLNITVETGDIVLIDTNQWYHDTFVLPDGGLSISIGSEYD